MPLLLTGTRDQALLALVIDEARRAADDASWYVGRTAIQKLVYFVQRRGVPSRYRFDLHHYGPYCAEIAKDLEWLSADGLLSDRSRDAGRYSDFRLEEDAGELLDKHREFVEDTRPAVHLIVAALGTLDPERLELLATLDFVHRWVRGAGNPAPLKDAVIDRFIEVKGTKFERGEVATVYDAMVETGVFADP